MAITEATVAFSEDDLRRIQMALRGAELDGWLLYDFHGSNPVAAAVLGLPPLTRRYFVLIPASGAPVALTHRIEQQPWQGWIGEQRVYLSWRHLEHELGEMLRGRGRIAMEYSPGDGVPYLDRTPAGVLEMVRASGVEVTPSGELVSAFYARWSEAGEASHRRAAVALREIAVAAMRRIGERHAAGEVITEGELRVWIQAEQERRGFGVGNDAIVAIGPNAANPHYAPSRKGSAPISPGDVVLVDLWAKEAEDAVFADQTWMGFVGDAPSERLQRIWAAVRDARDAAIAALRSGWNEGRPVQGCELDDVAREVIRDRGWGEHFIHRTGHSIDRELHGSGPNLDNLESRDSRRLIEGVGFSVEPGIYLPHDVGMRSEVNVFIGSEGPEITTPDPQRELLSIPTS